MVVTVAVTLRIAAPSGRLASRRVIWCRLFLEGRSRMSRLVLMAAAPLALLAFTAAADDTEWRVRVHRGDTYSEFTASEIDSLTFQETPRNMIWIPAGEVRLGQSGIAEPVHDVWVDGFWIGKYEVTNGEYREFIDAGGYSNPAWWNPVGWDWRVAGNITLPENWNSNQYHGGGIPGNEGFPVNGVSWWEADAWCRWAGTRLPTEAEWEKAARGPSPNTPTYPWGEGISGPRANYWQSGDPYQNNGWTTPVGYYDGSNHDGYQTIDSPGPYGLYDLAGNVWEWCSTKYASYPYDPDDGRENPPITPNECCRVFRGGSWGSATHNLRCAHRDSGHPHERHPAYGFRCARN